MQYWYFLFEGKLIAEKEFSRFYSSVMLPVQSSQNSVTVLESSLAEYNAILINVEDSFEFIAEEYDSEDSDNDSWFEWYKEVQRKNEPKFTPWQRFDDD